ncbi:antiviral reverse transcriptase Drt2 [Alteromonas macleodii]|uniref:antiviral reverse transcriptase Drt2 n=1 Tax=Alteromonas macleodii TaxID=28108 RepID=UPI0022AF4891|nr:antiviral reverse transcriptase Drt2 [Alteromonas macleodii]MCZ4241090.1 reverse transcriptase/maturase family protein [Alteromonas macleodii]
MHRKKHVWFKRRGYLHFDSPVSFKKAQKLVNSPKRVSTHSFYPLIHYSIKSFKVKLNAAGEIEPKWKTREIKYAAHLDSHIYAYYSWILGKRYEEEVQRRGLHENVLAFRSLGKNNIDFANDVFEIIKKKGRCSAVGLDITGFFDNLDHQVLKRVWSNLLGLKKLPDDHFAVYKSLTKYAYVDRTILFRELGISLNNPKLNRHRACTAEEFREKVRNGGLIHRNQNDFGIPQGSPVSALLSNIYMLDFDSKMKTELESQGGHYFRYCDDMLFITKPVLREDIERFALDEINKLELEINSAKTEVREFYRYGGQLRCKGKKSLQYLGFTFDGERKLIRSAALAKFSNRMKAGVRSARKTVRRTNSELLKNGSPPSEQLRKKKLYERYSHLGRRNFLTYGYRAAKKMNSSAIKKQLKPMWSRLQKEMTK